jgi:hypothetical protein
MMTFVFIFFIVPVVAGLTIDTVRGRFRKKNVADKVVVSEVGDELAVMDEARVQQVSQSSDDGGEKVIEALE